MGKSYCAVPYTNVAGHLCPRAPLIRAASVDGMSPQLQDKSCGHAACLFLRRCAGDNMPSSLCRFMCACTLSHLCPRSQLSFPKRHRCPSASRTRCSQLSKCRLTQYLRKCTCFTARQTSRLPHIPRRMALHPENHLPRAAVVAVWRPSYWPSAARSAAGGQLHA